MPPSPSQPPLPLNPEGRPRGVGVEIEFAGPACAEVAEALETRFGGRIEIDDAYRYKVLGTRLGDVTVELDMSLAHPDKSEGPIGEALRGAFAKVGGLILPNELSLAPLPVDRLAEADEVVEELRRLGAEGTGDGLLHAFGLHLNPEIASREADWVLDCLKAFALLEPWLRASIDIDVARSLSPFIGAYPDPYRARLALPEYRPGIGTLIDDYVAANPTRNRGLDMFPLFAELAPDRFRARIDDPHVKARPTFHYRLPNSRVGERGWSILPDWERWAEVERLAADRERLDDMGLDWLGRFRNRPASAWVQEVSLWLAR